MPSSNWAPPSLPVAPSPKTSPRPRAGSRSRRAKAIRALRTAWAFFTARALGVRRNFLEAYVWFDLAADRFEHGKRREQALELREVVGALISPEQLIEADRAIETRKAGWE